MTSTTSPEATSPSHRLRGSLIASGQRLPSPVAPPGQRRAPAGSASGTLGASFMMALADRRPGSNAANTTAVTESGRNFMVWCAHNPVPGKSERDFLPAIFWFPRQGILERYAGLSMISFIVPAHNEEAWIGRCLVAIRDAMESADLTPMRLSWWMIRRTMPPPRSPNGMARASSTYTANFCHCAGARETQGDFADFRRCRHAGRRSGVQRRWMPASDGGYRRRLYSTFRGMESLWFRVMYPLMVAVMRWRSI